MATWNLEKISRIDYKRLIMSNVVDTPDKPPQVWLNFFFILCRFMVDKDYQTVKDNPLPVDMHIFENKKLTEALITDHSLLHKPFKMNNYKIKHYFRTAPVEIDLNINTTPYPLIRKMLLGDDEVKGLLNQDGSLVLDGEGNIVAQRTLYKCAFTVEGIYKMSMEELFSIYHPKGVDHGSTRTATSLACALTANKCAICMNQTPYLPEVKNRYVGTGRILLYNGRHGLYASFHLEKANPEELSCDEFVDYENEVYGVMRVYRFNKEINKVEFSYELIGSLDKIKKEYYDGVSNKKKESRSRSDQKWIYFRLFKNFFS